MTGIGVRIKELRDERSLSMDALVEAMRDTYELRKLNKSMLSRWERNENEPSLEYAKYLAMFFNVSLDYMIGLTDDRTPSEVLSRISAYYDKSKKLMEEDK